MSTISAPAPSTVQPVTRADVLHRAADLLEEFGWCQNRVGGKNEGGFCALGAILEARADLGLRRFCGLDDGDAPGEVRRLVGDIPGWNNEPGRTKAEVVARLRAAADASPL